MRDVQGDQNIVLQKLMETTLIRARHSRGYYKNAIYERPVYTVHKIYNITLLILYITRVLHAFLFSPSSSSFASLYDRYYCTSKVLCGSYDVLIVFYSARSFQDDDAFFVDSEAFLSHSGKRAIHSSDRFEGILRSAYALFLLLFASRKCTKRTVCYVRLGLQKRNPISRSNITYNQFVSVI